MTHFEDPTEAAIEAREYKRRRMVRAIRGWLHVERRPKLTIALLLVVCAVFAAGFVRLFGSLGFESWSIRTLWAVLLVWPCFVLLLRWRTAAEFQRLRLDERADHFIRRDDVIEQELTESEEKIGRMIDEAMDRECAHHHDASPVAIESSPA